MVSKPPDQAGACLIGSTLKSTNLPEPNEKSLLLSTYPSIPSPGGHNKRQYQYVRHEENIAWITIWTGYDGRMRHRSEVHHRTRLLRPRIRRGASLRALLLLPPPLPPTAHLHASSALSATPTRIPRPTAANGTATFKHKNTQCPVESSHSQTERPSRMAWPEEGSRQSISLLPHGVTVIALNVPTACLASIEIGTTTPLST
jgi:hypothetical protein